MQQHNKIILSIIFLFVGLINLSAQNEMSPVVNYTFDNGIVLDKAGNSKLFLRNNLHLYDDLQMGSVLQFSAVDKSYAVLNINPLSDDSCSIAFFFYWDSENAVSWHQLFEIFDPVTNSNVFFTPQNGWGNNDCSFISQNNEFESYEAVSASRLPKNKWMHVAITIKEKRVAIFIDGEKKSSAYINFPPSLIEADSMYFGGNPQRTDNFYISAKLDDIKIFNKTLAPNQIMALSKGEEIPDAINNETNWNVSGDTIKLTIDLNNRKQTIQNFGASDGWNTERIGKYWPEEKKQKLADLLFSTEKDAAGSPRGIGLSSWRFNIGAGTAEQGEDSRISNESRRTECFRNADGSYNWEKQQGQQYFLKKAALDYNINHIIGWQNSPPVDFTINNLGFRDYGTSVSTILKPERYNDFANFLATVVDHFEEEGVDFDYISPLNEPQWGWNAKESGGTVTQEGTPWTNQEIYDVAVAINNSFESKSIDSKILLAEASSIKNLYSGNGHAHNQLNKFWNSSSKLSLTEHNKVANIVAYHSYFTDYGNNLRSTRETAFETAQKLTGTPELWQTEYSLLQNGYRFGYPENYRLSEMECALSLARVVQSDLIFANVSAWQWWTTFEQGKHGGESRFCLIEAFTKNDNTDGVYHLNKLFYSFGNFSHFIRPGMSRVVCLRSDNFTEQDQLNDVMISAFNNHQNDSLVVVAVNASNTVRAVCLNVGNLSKDVIVASDVYITDEYNNLSFQQNDLCVNEFIVPAKSVLTYTANIDTKKLNKSIKTECDFKAWYDKSSQSIYVKTSKQRIGHELKLFNMSGKLLQNKCIVEPHELVMFDAAHLQAGVYFVCDESVNVQKIIIIK